MIVDRKRRWFHSDLSGESVGRYLSLRIWKALGPSSKVDSLVQLVSPMQVVVVL